VTVGLVGGAFDPPHNGHLALARSALDHFDLARLIVLVAAAPGHKPVETDVEDRLRLTRLAFADLPASEIRRDDHPYTIDLMREGPFPRDALFLMGADQFADFLSWREPNRVLDHVRLAVATRPGYRRARLEEVLSALDKPERVELFEIPVVPVSSSEIRSRVGRGESIEGLVPDAVARAIEEAGLYRSV
jgi:nicotinate-nucleotide adenylyltransferase